jgi:nucleoside-diphosphate-sugar epimerase
VTHHAIVGAGQVGRRLARALVSTGAPVALISRTGNTVEGARGIAADASCEEALLEATRHAEVIYNCVNPRYHRWVHDWPPISDNLLAVARGKTLVTLSNLYGYGPVSGPMTESTPMTAHTSKGRVRTQMWEKALAAHEAGELRAVEVRGSDYIGEPGEQVVFGSRVVPRLAAGKSVQLIGRTDQPHTWTYTGDVAKTLAWAGSDHRAAGRAWHVPSNPARTQGQVVADLAAAMGVAVPRIRTAGHLQLRIAGLFSPTIGELVEMLYEFDRPFVMDSTATQDISGVAPTPWQTVIEETVQRTRVDQPG